MTALLLMTHLWACSSTANKANQAAAAVAEDPGFATCAVCEMVIQEQAPPRAQLVLRDGTHKHLCSIGDLRAWVQSPGPTGAPIAVFVEAQSTAAMEAPTREFGAWLRAEDASFVVGIDRPSVMGRPALVFADPTEASRAASAAGGYVVSWPALRDTPFHMHPPQPAQPGLPTTDPDAP